VYAAQKISADTASSKGFLQVVEAEGVGLGQRGAFRSWPYRRCHCCPGEDHPSTLTSAHSLAIDLYELGEMQAARDLAQDTLDRRRRVLGEDHPKTLASANNLAAGLRALGEADDHP